MLFRSFILYFVFVLTCSLPLVLVLCFCSCALCFDPYLSTMPRKTRANRTLSTSSNPPFDSERFLSLKNEEKYLKLNLRRKIWAKRQVLLDELDPTIRANFECKGWLPLLDIDHPPLAILIREFYSNLSCHIYDSNTLVRSWIRGVEFTITPRVRLLGCRLFGMLTIPMMSHPH